MRLLTLAAGAALLAMSTGALASIRHDVVTVVDVAAAEPILYRAHGAARPVTAVADATTPLIRIAGKRGP